MRGLFLILVVAVACSCADQCNTTPEAMTCRGLLKPIQSEEAKKAVMDKCIAAQPGLQATIDELKAAQAANASLPSAGAKAANASLPSTGAKAVANASQPSTGAKAANATLPSAEAKAANASLPSTGAKAAANATLPSTGAKAANATLPSTEAKAANASLPSTGAKAAANATLPSTGAKAANATLPSAEAKVANATLPSAGAKVANATLPSAGAEAVKPDPDCGGELKQIPARLLKAAGKTAEMATLNKCLAKENGYLVGAARGISIFDVAKFKAEINAKVAGSSSQGKTQLGLNKCPEDDLADFNVYKYMECVKAYCATGTGPNKKA